MKRRVKCKTSRESRFARALTVQHPARERSTACRNFFLCAAKRVRPEPECYRIGTRWYLSCFVLQWNDRFDFQPVDCVVLRERDPSNSVVSHKYALKKMT